MIVETAPVMARPLVEKIAPNSGVSKVVPQVGQPAPSAMSPVIILAFSMFSEFLEPSVRFLCQRSTMRPIRMPWSKEIRKIGSHSRKILLTPKTPIKASPRILMVPENPLAAIRSNLAKPPERRFSKTPKNRKVMIKPHRKRRSLVASKTPFDAKTNSSSHFLQFMPFIIAQVERDLTYC